MIIGLCWRPKKCWLSKDKPLNMYHYHKLIGIDGPGHISEVTEYLYYIYSLFVVLCRLQLDQNHECHHRWAVCPLLWHGKFK